MVGRSGVGVWFPAFLDGPPHIFVSMRNNKSLSCLRLGHGVLPACFARNVMGYRTRETGVCVR